MELELYPLFILAVGVTVVLTMILAFRINAFIALITAALVVSFMSPGEMASKVTRVASAFGSSAGGIGIIIAMAAVIGKCLMDSGAAERIVRSMLKALGEKRAPVALMGSGYILSVPVFFDTVFYLLVPLARSLWTKKRKNYVLYVTAIAAGGIVTHSMVPPTPGPLAMAAAFNVDVGVMILVGGLIGIPMSVVGLLFCGFLNKKMPIEMRPYPGEEEPEPLDESKMPSLWLSLLPVVLPVLAIAANTITGVIASPRTILPNDVTDLPALIAKVQQPTDEVSAFINSRLSEEVRQALSNFDVSDTQSTQTTKDALAANLNEIISGGVIYEETRFADVQFTERTAELIEKSERRNPTGEDLVRFNRLLLEDAYPSELAKNPETLRVTRGLTSIFGDPSFALMVSAAISLLLVAKFRGHSLSKLAEDTEHALMSGGLVILITAAGGAFGLMLRQAGIDGSIRTLMGEDASMSSFLILSSAFGVAALMKFAQGSGTVSMITTSGMFAAMGLTLNFHPVFLLCAIGSGSMVGDWMNNSGFWVFSKMSCLTTQETLKTWTALAAVMGITGFIVTLIAVGVVSMFS